MGEAPQPEPLDTPEEYGLTDLGENHWSLDDVYRRIHEARSWWVVSVRPDSRPHAAPVWGLALKQRAIFSSGPEATKSRNLDANPGIVLHLESGDEVVIVEGTVTRITHDQLPDGYADRYNAKYDVELDFADPAFRFFEVQPTKIMAWDEGDFAATAARWRYNRDAS
jgi:hypothetical protein